MRIILKWSGFRVEVWGLGTCVWVRRKGMLFHRTVGEKGKPPSGPIETMQRSCDNCRLERWYAPRSLPDVTAQQTTILCRQPSEPLNSKLRSPLQLNQSFTLLSMPRDPCFFTLLPNYFYQLPKL